MGGIANGSRTPKSESENIAETVAADESPNGSGTSSPRPLGGPEFKHTIVKDDDELGKLVDPDGEKLLDFVDSLRKDDKIHPTNIPLPQVCDHLVYLLEGLKADTLCSKASRRRKHKLW